MSIAITRVFASALGGNSKGRPQLVDEPLPLTARIAALLCRGGGDRYGSIKSRIERAIHLTHPTCTKR